VKYLGIDWATEHHDLALIDASGSMLLCHRIAVSWSAVTSLLELLEEQGGSEQIMVAVEAGAPRLSEAFAAAGYTVYEINPLQSDRFRDRFSPAGCKDDRLDARVLADALRTDHHRLRPRRAVADEILALRDRCRWRQTLVDQRRRAAQQLRQLLSEYHPALMQIGGRGWDAFVLAVLRAYPTPSHARTARRPRLARLVREHRIRRVDVEQLRSALHAQTFPLEEAAARSHADHALALAEMIETVSLQIKRADAAITELFDQQAEKRVLMSVPGMGPLLAPYVAAETIALLGAQPAIDALQAIAGTCPRTRRSGKHTHGSVRMRRRCNRRLQTALFEVARCSRARSGWAKAYVEYKRVNGATRNNALRALSNKWAKIIAALLASGEEYDEERHVATLIRNQVPWAAKLKQQREEAA
jgi:hypothetical protein